MVASEKVLERNLCAHVKKIGGLCLKYHNSNEVGYPDRIVILPNGVVVFVELKSSNGRLSKMQEKRIKELKARRCWTFVIDSHRRLDILKYFLGYLLSRTTHEDGDSTT